MDTINNFRSVLLDRLAYYFPYIVIFLMVAGFLFAFLIGRIDYAIRGLSIGVPAIIAALLLLLFRKDNSPGERKIVLFRLNDKIVYILFIFIYALSIISLYLSSYRPIYYFILISILYCLIGIQILSQKLRPHLILFQIIFVLINLSYGLTFNYPFYFWYTDTFSHIFLIDVTMVSGHIIPMDLSLGYAQFPLYHIFFAITTLLLGIPIQSALFLISIVPYALLVLVIYLLFREISQNEQISLLSCLLYSLIPVVILYNAYIVTRVLAYIGFIIFFYLLYLAASRNKKLEFSILVLCFTIFIILVHQVSIAQISFLLILFIISERVVNEREILHLNYILFILVAFVSYWIYTSFVFFSQILKSRVDILFSENSYNMVSPSVQRGNEWSYVLTHIDYSIMVFLIICGLGIILWQYKRKYSLVFGIFALITIIFFIPNPLQLSWFNMYVFRSDRIVLLLAPFFAFVMGFGLYSLIKMFLEKGSSVKVWSMVFLIVIGSFSFMSMTLSNASDCQELKFNEPRLYFNQQELYSLEYVKNYIPYGSELSSDYCVNRYFNAQKKFSSSEFWGLPYYSSSSLTSGYDGSDKGYLIFRDEEYFSRGLLVEGDLGGNLETLLSSTRTERNQISMDKIYDSEAVHINLV